MLGGHRRPAVGLIDRTPDAAALPQGSHESQAGFIRKQQGLLNHGRGLVVYRRCPRGPFGSQRQYLHQVQVGGDVNDRGQGRIALQQGQHGQGTVLVDFRRLHQRTGIEPLLLQGVGQLVGQGYFAQCIQGKGPGNHQQVFGIQVEESGNLFPQQVQVQRIQLDGRSQQSQQPVELLCFGQFLLLFGFDG